ncbi:MAG: rod shape-determining protein MreC [Prevotella sp.]|jgi:rod shape-determining protein MreC|nr:rod shape-determining protein MreC [Prevotella sp.]
MRNLLEFLAKYNHWFVFLILEIISFVLLFKFNSYQGSVWFSTANAVSGQMYEWDSQVESFFAMGTLNGELTKRNIYLEQQVAHLREQLADAKIDSSAAEAQIKKSIAGIKYIQAKVVSNTLSHGDNLITINRGAADGVKKDMGVVSGNGVVGVVYLVSAHYSVVIPVLNSHSNISCMIAKRGYFGTLHWIGPNSRLAYLEDLPRHARFKIGDDVVTSGYSAIFPSGVLVGKVLHVYNSPDGLSYRAQILLSTNFGKLRDVCVIDNAPMQEQLEVMRAAVDSIKVYSGKD